MPDNYNKIIQSLSVGTIYQNFGFYTLVVGMLLIIIVQLKVLDERKNKKP